MTQPSDTIFSASFLTPDTTENFSGTSILLIPAFFWCQHCSVVSIPLVSALFWYQHCSGTSIVLVPAFFWCQHCSGTSNFLVSALFWYQHFSDASIPLVSAFLWCQHSSGTTLPSGITLPLGKGKSLAICSNRTSDSKGRISANEYVLVSSLSFWLHHSEKAR
jgi:hypothetical protein